MLVLSLAFVAFAPMSQNFTAHPFVWMIGGFFVLAVVAQLRGKWARFDRNFALLLAAEFAVIFFLAPKDADPQVVLALRSAAWTSLVLLNGALLIGPWSRFTDFGLHFYKHRRHIGVTAFLFGLLHAHLVLRNYFNYDLSAIQQDPFLFFGLTALLVMAILAAISWDYVQKKVPALAWKITHTVLLFAYSGILFWFWRIGGSALFTWQKILLITFLVYWILVAPWSVIRLVLRFVNGWKQVHVLVYIAYAAMMVHVSTGVLAARPLGFKILFWGLFATVTLSHVAGWIMKIITDRHVRRAEEKVVIEGKTYYKLGHERSFHEGRGTLIRIGKVDLAIYKYQGKLFAMSNRCPHQGGPIYKGEIRNGYVECPWHRYQFSVSSGKGPPGYDDVIPYYHVAVRDGVGYVAID